MNDNIEVILLVHCDRLFPDIIRLVRRMRNLNSPSFRAKELSQSLSTMSMYMGMVVSMLRSGITSRRIGADQSVRCG
jgi:hypothetical protein